VNVNRVQSDHPLRTIYSSPLEMNRKRIRVHMYVRSLEVFYDNRRTTAIHHAHSTVSIVQNTSDLYL